MEAIVRTRPSDLIQSIPAPLPQIHESEPLPGDILVFLSGQEDIEALAQLLEEEKDALQAAAGAGGKMATGSAAEGTRKRGRCRVSLVLCVALRAFLE